ncbi:Plakophilin-2 [Varanus komodoensis]|nr:Plakophilin-2 [Varanus komodoensis]
MAGHLLRADFQQGPPGVAPPPPHGCTWLAGLHLPKRYSKEQEEEVTPGNEKEAAQLVPMAVSCPTAQEPQLNHKHGVLMLVYNTPPYQTPARSGKSRRSGSTIWAPECCLFSRIAVGPVISAAYTGSLHRTSSVPEYVYKLDAVETDFASRPFLVSASYSSHQDACDNKMKTQLKSQELVNTVIAMGQDMVRTGSINLSLLFRVLECLRDACSKCKQTYKPFRLVLFAELPLKIVREITSLVYQNSQEEEDFFTKGNECHWQTGSHTSYENGWGLRTLPYNHYRVMEEKSQRQPLKRLEVSPNGSPDKLAYFQNGFQYNRGLNLRYGESKRSSDMPPRYARSEIVSSRNRSAASQGQRVQRQFYIGAANGTAVDGIPTSPGAPVYQRPRSSRSMVNLLERESYLTSGAALGQMHREALRSSWHQSTFRSQDTREASQLASISSATAEGGGKGTMTAAMAAAAGSAFAEQEKIATTGFRHGTSPQEISGKTARAKSYLRSAEEQPWSSSGAPEAY